MYRFYVKILINRIFFKEVRMATFHEEKLNSWEVVWISLWRKDHGESLADFSPGARGYHGRFPSLARCQLAAASFRTHREILVAWWVHGSARPFQFQLAHGSSRATGPQVKIVIEFSDQPSVSGDQKASLSCPVQQFVPPTSVNAAVNVRTPMMLHVGLAACSLAVARRKRS